jgi:hypothetical protein
MTRFARSRLDLLFVAAALLSWASPATSAEKLSYARDVRPILSNNCFYCHGPDPKTREADLRLDTREGAIDPEHHAVKPGDAQASQLVERIFSTDPDALMPPPHAKKALTAEQKAILKRWIEEGAEYEGHFAFQPIRAAARPAVKQAGWGRNEIDQFVLAELERRGIAPSGEADRATLIRRLTLDLIGLLPTPEEVEAFEKDDRSDAYERLVERLLDSPHYGERWGRYWLDQARYADSNGYTIDSERSMWPYRDWVIQALNNDMPFDQFTIEQLAGDLLSNATRMQKIASAFHRNTTLNEEGGTDAEQFRNEIVVDRVNTTGSVWLGLTLGCAQCHSHKFDPISHKEYFEFFAFFNHGTDINNRGETLDVLPGEVFGTTTPETLISPAAKEFMDKRDTLLGQKAMRRAAWEKRLKESPPTAPTWSEFDIERWTAESGRKVEQLPDKTYLASAEGAPNDNYELLATSPLKQMAAIRLEVLPHESLPNEGSGTAKNGNFVLSEFEVVVNGKKAPIAYALADHEKKDYPVTAAIDDDRKTGWALEMGQGGKGRHEAWFIFPQPIAGPISKITIKLRHDVNAHYLVGHFGITLTDTLPALIPSQEQWAKTLAAVGKPEADRSADERQILDRSFDALDIEQQVASREADRLTKKPSNTTTIMVMQEAAKPRDTYIHLRGDFLSPDKATGSLTPNTPAVLPPLNAPGRPTRLDLARWLVRADNPLTPRVTVNRIWMRYFGQGLVETENDFGMQGTPPTHPELLDWLAARFIADGWSMKSLHRTIVQSATYRQSSHYRPELISTDPTNQWLSHQNRVRFEAETVRDASLSASGLFNPAIGGPTVRPPQPEGVYAFTQTKKVWTTSTGPDRYRRALYTQFIRSAPYPLFTTFDAPSLSSVCTRRPRSNTPLQALTMANDEVFIELAKGLSNRLWSEIADRTPAGDRSRVERAIRICYGRSATSREVDLLTGYVTKQHHRYSDDSAAAKLVAASHPAGGIDEATSAAWSALARVLMNTDEFITRE